MSGWAFAIYSSHYQLAHHRQTPLTNASFWQRGLATIFRQKKSSEIRKMDFQLRFIGIHHCLSKTMSLIVNGTTNTQSQSWWFINSYFWSTAVCVYAFDAAMTQTPFRCAIFRLENYRYRNSTERSFLTARVLDCLIRFMWNERNRFRKTDAVHFYRSNSQRWSTITS